MYMLKGFLNQSLKCLGRLVSQGSYAIENKSYIDGDKSVPLRVDAELVAASKSTHITCSKYPFVMLLIEEA